MRNLSTVVFAEVEVIVLPFSNSPYECEIKSDDLDIMAIDECLRDGSNGTRHR